MACGAEVVVVAVCSGCGQLLQPGSRFCHICGTAVGSTPRQVPRNGADQHVAERRVTSVLFGDLVGFTPLSETRDSEEVRELLSAYFQRCRVIVTRYGGQVEKFIGDAVMAVWGVPVAHEDDAERAVRAGLDLVRMVDELGGELGIPGLAQRVGIVTAEVAVTVGATAEGMVAGDAVNTAARVQSVADSGRVWVDDATRALASAAITFDDAGEHLLKGKAEAVRLWAAGVVVAQVGGGQRVDGLEAPLVGRDADLRLVKELFHATQEAQRPRLVIVEGEPGIGKSRLGWEFSKYTDGLADSMRWLRGRCLSYGDGAAFWALAEALRARFGLVETDTGPMVLRHLDQGLVEFVADDAEREWLRPRLAVLLGASDASYSREDLFAAWTAFFEHLAVGETAVVLVIDDAQYADEGLLTFLDYLLATARSPLFVLALARPELLNRRPNLGGRRASVVHLEGLSDADMASMIEGLVQDLPDSTREMLVRRAEGVPLFAIETVRALIDRDLVIPRDGRYVLAGGRELDLDDVGIPASLQALVAARLDLLSPEEKALVADASVLGLSFTPEALLALGCDPEHLDPILASLREKEILALQTDRFSAEFGQHRFLQSVFRQVAYSTQSKRDRKARHLAAAHHFEAQPDPGNDLAVVIAQHLLDALDSGQESDDDAGGIAASAVQHLERAAIRAQSVGAPAEAYHLLVLALERSPDAYARAELDLRAARTAYDTGDYPGAVSHGTRAMNAFGAEKQDISAGSAAAVCCKALFALNDLPGAVEVAHPHWESLQQVTGAESALLDLAEALAEVEEYRGDRAAVALYADEMIRRAEFTGDHRALARAFCRLSFRYDAVGARRTSIVLAASAAEIAREHDLNFELSTALKDLGATEISGDLASALEHFGESRTAAQRSGVRRALDIATSNLLVALYIAGRLDEASDVARDFDALGSTTSRLVAHSVALWIADARGLERPELPPLIESDNVQVSAWQWCLDIARDSTSPDLGPRARLAMDELTAAVGLGDDFYLLWPHLTLAVLDAGHVALARDFLQLVPEQRVPHLPAGLRAQWHRLQGLVTAAEGGAADQVEPHLRAGVEGLDAFGARVFSARAREELGRWLVDQGRADEARELLEHARAAYAEMGAAGWVDRLDDWQARHGLAHSA